MPEELKTPMQEFAWFSPDLRHDLVRMVQKRVPSSDVEDVVQATLIDAFAGRKLGAAAEPAEPAEPAERAPANDNETGTVHPNSDARGYVFGIARHKIADYYRKNRRESLEEVHEVATAPEPHEAESMLRWAEKRAGTDQQTLGWLLREGEGDALENIAAEAQIPAPRVRKRVSRLRQHLRENWKKEVLALAAFGILSTLVAVYFKMRTPTPNPIAREPQLVSPFGPKPANELSVDERAELLRTAGLVSCSKHEYEACLRDLNSARSLSPAGDSAAEIQRARREAERALIPLPNTPGPNPSGSSSNAPVPTSGPSSAPTSATPVPSETDPSDMQKIPTPVFSGTPSMKPVPHSTSSSLDSPAPFGTTSMMSPPIATANAATANAATANGPTKPSVSSKVEPTPKKVPTDNSSGMGKK